MNILCKVRFHIIATTAAIAEKKNVQQSLRSRGIHFLALVVITLNHIETNLYKQHSDQSRHDRSTFFGSDRSHRSNHMETNLYT